MSCELLRCTRPNLAHSRMLAKAPGQSPDLGVDRKQVSATGETLSPSALDPQLTSSMGAINGVGCCDQPNVDGLPSLGTAKNR